MTISALAAALSARQLTLATAESCTGGLVAKCLTDLPGSSAWFECGVVTYSNASKIQLLGVKPALLEQFGAVSEAVACSMSEGLLQRSAATVTLSTTGIAGPGGGSAEKPVGLVCFALSHHALPTQAFTAHFAGVRAQVRESAVAFILSQLERYLKSPLIA